MIPSHTHTHVCVCARASACASARACAGVCACARVRGVCASLRERVRGARTRARRTPSAACAGDTPHTHGGEPGAPIPIMARVLALCAYVVSVGVDSPFSRVPICAPTAPAEACRFAGDSVEAKESLEKPLTIEGPLRRLVGRQCTHTHQHTHGETR